MLTKEQMADNKERFVEALKPIDFDLERFMLYLDSPRVDFFAKPLNPHPEKAYAGSLCEHCLRVHEELRRLCAIYAPGVYGDDEIAEAALLKDLYRGELYEPYLKNQKNDLTGQWEQLIAFKTKDVRPMFGDIGFSSYMIAKKFIPGLSDGVIEAICQSGSPNGVDAFGIRKMHPLVALTAMAEVAAAYIEPIGADIETEAEQDAD